MSEHAYSTATMSRVRAGGGEPRHGAGEALGVAGLCVLGLALVWSLANLVPGLQLRDSIALHDFTLLSRPRIDAIADFLLHLLDPLEFVLWAVALVAVALARERPRVALAVAAVMALAPLTTEKLKPLLAHPHVAFEGTYVGPASWPSGHSTAALALVLCAVLVTPARLRALVGVIGAGFALAVGVSLLILAWHMPSDVLGGYLVATCWAALAVAALRAAERRWPTRPDSEPARGLPPEPPQPSV
ncbi:MAG TPA: phosphatase PAP2 family protein [Solirubrobacteraceae bacterium]|nr:phosphatase PAP2 family protein [Solirubrobacteraceae bacterium]